MADIIDWAQCKADLHTDDFDNGRTPAALERSCGNSAHVAIAREGERVVGMARLLSDGVCNAYLLDVWTRSTHRRQGIGGRMVRASWWGGDWTTPTADLGRRLIAGKRTPGPR